MTLFRAHKAFNFFLLGMINSLGFFFSAPTYAESYVLYSYHNVPPFVTGEGTGLTYDLAAHLSKSSREGHHYSVKILPRKRLNELMSRESIIVPWVIPVWFKGSTSSQTSWSSPIMIDSSVYVWKAERSKRFKSPEDLVGAKLGGIRGYKYVGVDPLVKSNKVKRTDTSSEWQLLQMVLSERVDVGIIPEAGACNLIRTHKLAGKLKISQHHSFARKIMITGTSQKHLLPELNSLKNHPTWTKTLAKYGTRIAPLGDRNEDNYCDEQLTTAELTLN
ncbi:hypothetical protein [Kiloniella sp.]|uniref:hypothetical protein n=1 Tax=Kiloniella sp. TaxID=1938587 RepID=UPI003B0114EE